jgi:hypothetical protein
MLISPPQRYKYCCWCVMLLLLASLLVLVRWIFVCGPSNDIKGRNLALTAFSTPTASAHMATAHLLLLTNKHPSQLKVSSMPILLLLLLLLLLLRDGQSSGSSSSSRESCQSACRAALPAGSGSFAPATCHWLAFAASDQVPIADCAPATSGQ